MCARKAQRHWPWDSYVRIASVLREFGIDPDAAFERLEWLGRPYGDDRDGHIPKSPPRDDRAPIDPDDCKCDGCGLRRLTGWRLP